MPMVIQFCEHVAERMDHPLLQERPMIFFMGTQAKNVTNNVLLLCAVRAHSRSDALLVDSETLAMVLTFQFPASVSHPQGGPFG